MTDGDRRSPFNGHFRIAISEKITLEWRSQSDSIGVSQSRFLSSTKREKEQ
ncbi:MAG: hypothetical protein WBB29_00940 [Geitlerinemataceae cyanobacterium]